MKRQFLFVGGALDGTWHWVECPEDFNAPPPKQTQIVQLQPLAAVNFDKMPAATVTFTHLYVATPWAIGADHCYIYVHNSMTVKQALERLITNYRPIGGMR